MKVQLQVHGQVISAGVGLDPVGQRAGFMPAVKIYLLTSKPQINFFLPTLVIFKIFILMPRNRCCFPFPSPLSTFILLGASLGGGPGGRACSNSICNSQRQNSAELAPALPSLGGLVATQVSKDTCKGGQEKGLIWLVPPLIFSAQVDSLRVPLKACGKKWGFKALDFGCFQR